ncbi:restriction endonuclease [candidate division TA06 bacterium]|uniref:Restriction endonuclease n=1 Tax=candidate division TA06 bacterium TaxID=2250710 RepID=A0A933I9J2_UNCT6|nr:restriction endonuclease [candidate division TA06 bacterium]
MKANKQTEALIKAYNLLVKGIETKANEDEERAYGGTIRAGKGLLVENIGKQIIEIAWADLGANPKRLSFVKKPIKIPLRQDYLKRIQSQEIIDWIRSNVKDFYYAIKTDIHVNIDDDIILGIECKAYTENAMIKRILVDFTLLKQVHPDLMCALLQLESQLTGDYSKPSQRVIFGSHSTHTLLSYFDIALNIVTLLEGERKVDEPIHKPEYYKKLEEKNLLKAVEIFKGLLKDRV